MNKMRFRFSTIAIIFALVASFILISCSSIDDEKTDIEVDDGNGIAKELSSLNITHDDRRLVRGTPFTFKTAGVNTDLIVVDNLSDKSVEWKVTKSDDTDATGVTFVDGINNKNEVKINFTNAGDYKILTTLTDTTTAKKYTGVKQITVYASASGKTVASIIHDTPKKGVMNFKAIAGTDGTGSTSKTYKWKVTKYNSMDAISGIIEADTALNTTIDFTAQPVGKYIVSLYAYDGEEQIDNYEGSINISDKENFSIAIGDNHTLIADINSDLLYVYGVNDNGQLGTGNNDNITTPTILKNSNVRFIKQVSAGKNHSLLLAGTGEDIGIHQNYKIYAWGDNTYGQLGTTNDSSTLNVDTPTVVVEMEADEEPEAGGVNSDDMVIPATKYFNGIGAGGDQSFAYSNYKSNSSSKRVNSMLAEWGRGEKDTIYSRIPKYASEGPRGGVQKGTVQFLAVGVNHIVMRYTWAYNLASFGSNSHGQAGKCETVGMANGNIPYCDTIGGDISTGGGNYHYPGYRPSGFNPLYTHYVFAPRGETGTWVAYVDNVPLAAAGDSFSLLIRNDGSLYSFGKNDKGQLGLGNDTETGTKTKNKFQPIKVFQGRLSDTDVGDKVTRKEVIVDIATGYSHSYAIDKEGKLFTWGDNSKGQLLSDPKTDTEFSAIPTGITITGITKILDIWAGANRSIALGDDRNLYTWGENKNSLKLLGVEEVGTDKDYHSVPIKMMFPLADIGH